ncbi:hypothetical protein HO133_008885 [Letharia lupina]|uniref:C2H2-type domain-containing protein n=1 Tax=Letharia lupina TaxID=560253 RepID=A0A8H6CQF3_9LECA|nr:uncharacterized protein HO133_008885 [Letharia lupina]KAF6227441.1 hypothetical protein HO133_008885 [Letharia lupina]
MVSFSCEACGDVLTKKKLDAHHRQTHTSCVSEDQKYQGTLYKEKPAKKAKKSVKISEPTSHAPRKAYVEDALDEETGNAVSIVNAPPAAPTPPSAIPSTQDQHINVFDFLVSGDTPNASKTNIEGMNDSMKMVEQSPSILGNGHREAGLGIYDEAYDKLGFTYGSEPIPVAKERFKVEYLTPAPKSVYMQNPSTDSVYNLEDSERRSTDKKRKRVHAEELEFTAARRPSRESDHIMADAPPPILHSGLTGGLGRLLTKSKFPPRSELSNGGRDPPSPVKRTIKPAAKEKDRGRKAESILVKVRKRRSSDESRPRKQRRSHHESDRHSQHSHHDRPKRKAIEYHTQTDPDDSQQQLVLFKTRAELFTSFVTKGPESEQGYSLHKALKRYHRERGEEGLGLEKADEEKELFKALRLRRNDKGEIVVFF